MTPTWGTLESVEVGVGVSATWDSASVPDGAHDFAVRLVDEGGDDVGAEVDYTLRFAVFDLVWTQTDCEITVTAG